MLVICIVHLQAQTTEGYSNSVHVKIGMEEDEEEEAIPSLKELGITKVPNFYALIIGVSDYAYDGPGLSDLDMPVKDAEKLFEVLTRNYAFNPEHVKILRNPGREEIIDQFESLAGKLNSNDNLLVFYAGHGYFDASTEFGYWLPADAKTDSRSAWISNTTVKDYIGAIPAKHSLLITDACFGGSIFKSRSVSTLIKRFYDTYKDQSRRAMTSGALTEVPDRSVFIKYLLKELEENEDPFVSSAVLFSRIFEPVVNNTTTNPQIGVIQGAGDEGGDFVFIKRN